MRYLIAGPPGAGKTTYIRKHAKPNDLIVDLEELEKHTGNRKTAAEYRVYLENQPYTKGDVWIARTLPDPRDRATFARTHGIDKTITLTAPPQVLKERTSTRDGNDTLHAAIDRWTRLNPVKESPMSEETTTIEPATEAPTADTALAPVATALASEVNEHGYPDKTPVADMTIEQQVAYWKYHARKHENTVKELRANTTSTAPAPVEENTTPDAPATPAVPDYTQERADMEEALFSAYLENAQVKNPGVNVAPLMGALNIDSFRDENGKLSRDKVTDWVVRLAPEKPAGLPATMSNPSAPTKTGNGSSHLMALYESKVRRNYI